MDMKRFLDVQMPTFVEKVNGSKELAAFQEKAGRHGLPQVMLFASKANTSPLTKYLSTEFRRRLLLAQINPTKPNKEIMDKYGISELPAMVVIVPASEGEKDDTVVVYGGNKKDEGFTKNKLQKFLSKYALKNAVVPKKKEEGKEERTKQKEEPKEKKRVHSEL